MNINYIIVYFYLPLLKNIHFFNNIDASFKIIYLEENFLRIRFLGLNCHIAKIKQFKTLTSIFTE